MGPTKYVNPTVRLYPMVQTSRYELKGVKRHRGLQPEHNVGVKRRYVNSSGNSNLSVRVRQCHFPSNFFPFCFCESFVRSIGSRKSGKRNWKFLLGSCSAPAPPRTSWAAFGLLLSPLKIKAGNHLSFFMLIFLDSVMSFYFISPCLK